MLVLGFLLLIQERMPFEPIREVKWKLCPYWIQIHGLPIKGFTESNILKIGARFGEIMEYERPVIKNVIVRSFMRIMVSGFRDLVWVNAGLRRSMRSCRSSVSSVVLLVTMLEIVIRIWQCLW